MRQQYETRVSSCPGVCVCGRSSHTNRLSAAQTEYTRLIDYQQRPSNESSLCVCVRRCDSKLPWKHPPHQSRNIASEIFFKKGAAASSLPPLKRWRRRPRPHSSFNASTYFGVNHLTVAVNQMSFFFCFSYFFVGHISNNCIGCVGKTQKTRGIFQLKNLPTDGGQLKATDLSTANSSQPEREREQLSRSL